MLEGLSPEDSLAVEYGILDQFAQSGIWAPGQPLRLNLGCGETRQAGFVNIDLPPEQHNLMRVDADAFADIRDLFFPPDSVDEVHMHYVLSHFSRVVALGMLIRIHLWLKRGASVLIETPDMLGTLSGAFGNASLEQKMHVSRHLAGDQAALWGYHREHWFEERFQRTLELLGFGRIEVASFPRARHPYLSDLRVTAVKVRSLSIEEYLECSDEILRWSMLVPEESATAEQWRLQLREFLLNGTYQDVPASAPVAAANGVEHNVASAGSATDIEQALKSRVSGMSLRDIHNFNQEDRDKWVAEKAKNLAPGSKILDVGAGTCPYRDLFAHCEYKTHDFKKYDGVKLGNTHEYGEIDYVSDILHIPVPDNSFDAILCTEVLEHLPRPAEALREMARILKPGGTALLTAPLGSLLHQIPYHFYGGYTPYWYRHFCEEFGLEIKELAQNGGFFRLLGQECARFGWTFGQHEHLHGENGQLLKKLFMELIPPYLFGMEEELFLDFATVGYHVEAVKKEPVAAARELKLFMPKTKEQALCPQFLGRLAELTGADVFVETGTFKGDTSDRASQIFATVHTIEVSPELHQKAVQRFQANPNIHCHLGDSATVMPQILPMPGRTPLFWLDGHFSGGNTGKGSENTPILSELRAIRDAGVKNACILVDDIRFFQEPITGAKYHEAVEGYPSMKELFEAVREIDPAYEFVVFGDIVFAFPEALRISVSPLLQACTISRMGETGCYQSSMLIREETECIAAATGEELCTLWELPDLYAATEEFGLGGHYRLWRGLTYLRQGKMDEAAADFRAAKVAGCSHWRVDQYLAQCGA